MSNIAIYSIIGTCLLISASGKAVMDSIRSCICTTVFRKWEGNKWIDPAVSWLNKYKNNDPKQGPKFIGSTTVFVFVTDLWHFSQFIFLRFFFSIPILYSFCHPIISWVVDYFIMSVIFGILFEVIYKILCKK